LLGSGLDEFNEQAAGFRLPAIAVID